MTPKQSTYSVLEEFSKHDPELIERNVAHVDLSWVAQQQGGEEIENQDISFILERLKIERKSITFASSPLIPQQTGRNQARYKNI